jgi:hypothetical protein
MNKRRVNANEGVGNRMSIREAQADLDEFNETKKTVTDLLNYKRSLIDIENSDFDKINAIKSKAIEAINNLFNDIINTPKDSKD